ncbi:hypothetical protein SAMN05216246_11215 [Actinomyces denticolens]|uniref:Uncharacterized protein n=1 Tax=Actinomyces denticolens TaxID=52767 RepID=A0ABY1IG74_9ACTO|nr:hypothetical protein [Actinomyces denticolens]SHJ13092.1 hypothetical protein SAMN05216246_11215 [Actinomyces denticolens]
MKPSPRPRKTPVVPKAVGPDPALIGASTSVTSNTDNASNASVDGGASTPRSTDSAAPTVKITVRIDAGTAAKARTAYRLSLADTDTAPTSFSAWVAGVIADAVTAAEAAHGPLPPTEPGILPTGRPTGR